MVAVWFAPAGIRPLTRTDEGRYAEIPREMFRSGDWLTPRLDGFLYFEKPPLQYWATAAAYAVLGLTELAARFWTALTGLLAVVLVWFTGRRLFSREAGFASALVLATSLFWLALSRINTLDIGVSFFLAVAVCGFCLGQRFRDDRVLNRRYMLMCWAGMGLATMSKGLMGIVLPGAALVLYTAAQRDGTAWRRLHLGKGLALFLAIAAPWHVAMTLAHDSFARFYFYFEHFERFLSEEGHERYKPLWWFLPVLVGGILPWIAFAARPAVRGWRRREEPGRFDARRMLWIWTAFVFLFFSVSKSKLLGYLGPCFPTLALLAGPELVRGGRIRFRITAGITAAFGVAAVAVAFFVARLNVPDATPEMLAGTRPWLLAGGVALVAAGAVAWRRAGEWRPAAVAVAAGWLVGLSLVLTSTVAIEPANSSRSLAAAIRPHLAGGVPFYSVDRYDQSLPFYVDRTLILVKRRGELKFGIGQDPEAWIPTLEAFRDRWLDHRRALAILNIEQYEEWKGDLPMRLLWEDDRRAVVARP